MSENHLTTNLENGSDDEDLFVSTYEKPPTEKKLIESKVVSNEEMENTNIPIAPPRKQSTGQTVEKAAIDNLESEMNTIDLNDTNENEDESSKLKTCAILNENTNENVDGTIEDKMNFDTKPDLPTNVVNKEANVNKTIPTVSINTASQISISVSEPQKVGEGIGSYIVYTVVTRTTLPYFRRQSMSVNRRFSDFLGLHSKLSMKHGPVGRIVPPPPAKSAFGTAKVKMTNNDINLHSMDFVAKRRAALERYLQRNAEHPILCSDPDFREFLELDTELPRSTSTSALSGAGMKRLFSFVGDTVQKMTFKMEEIDPWFESKQQQVEILDSQLRKLQVAVDSLLHNRKELTSSLDLLGKSTALIGHDESNVSLSCALSHLASTHEKVEKIYETQSNYDFLYLSELLRDYVGLIGSVKEAFYERVKCFQNLSNLELSLNRKRESKTKVEMALRNENLTKMDEEIKDLQDKVEKAKEDFEQISETIKQEFERFDMNRIRDFKNNFLKYMEALLATQESLIECWEAFLPEAKSISA